MSGSPEESASQERDLEVQLHGKDCPETDCDAVEPTMDHLVDHLTDEHDAYTWVTRGCPINE